MITSMSHLLQPLITSAGKRQSSVYIRIFRCLLCSLLIGIVSPLAIFLPFSPIPIVLQVHLCLFFASIYGSREGLTIVVMFLLQGIMGAPVFAGGSSGIMPLLGPSGGYLMGYALGAFCTGRIVERYKNRSILAMGIGNAIVYIVGAVQLSIFIPMSQAWLFGVLPYIPLDLLKIAFFAKLISSYRDLK